MRKHRGERMGRPRVSRSKIGCEHPAGCHGGSGISAAHWYVPGFGQYLFGQLFQEAGFIPETGFSSAAPFRPVFSQNQLRDTQIWRQIQPFTRLFGLSSLIYQDHVALQGLF